MKTFNSIEETQPYYNEKTNTYDFEENGIYLDVRFAFDLSTNANINARNIEACNIRACNINAWNINAQDIDARDIDALDIKALNINARNIDAGNINVRNIDALDIYSLDIHARNIHARNISYYGICSAYETFVCKSILGGRKNAKYFCLDSEVKIEQVTEQPK